MDQKSRGRARGRARVGADQQQSGAPTRGGPGASRPGGAWGSGNPMRGNAPSSMLGDGMRATGPAPAQPQQPVAWGPQAPRHTGPPAQSTVRPEFQGNRGDPRDSVTTVSRVSGPGNGGDSGHSGRGGVRGHRAIPETTLTTRMPDVTKQGHSGRKINIQTNYFRVEKRADWCIYQYRVDFAPEIDVTFTKKKLFYTGVASMELGSALFDGTVLYTPFRINPDPKEIVVDSLTNPDEKVRITIRMVGELHKSSYQYLQVYNLIMRKCMSHLKLQLIRRDYFDPANKIVVASLNLELWPGIVTSIRQHETDVLMCAEIKHKIMKTETAHIVMRKMMNERDRQDWRTRFHERMLNTIVLTDYNNKTYRVDDVDFDRSPNTSFTLKDGSSVTFSEYYRQRYGLTITDMTQPLLVTKIKQREPRGEGCGGGGDGPQEATMLLIPEFCRMTGLTEEERTNRIMKDNLEKYMMPTPKTRIENLARFNARLQSNPGSMQEMKRFDLSLSKDILSLTARQLDTETLYFQPNAQACYSAMPDAEWSKNTRGKPMYRTAAMSTWAIVYSNKDKDGVQAFYANMTKAATGMKWNLGKPLITALDDARKPYDKQAFGKTIEELTAKHPNLMFVLLFVPSNRTDHYGFIKKKLTVDKGIPSQIVVVRNCYHKSMFSIATKVVVQINCKLGGAPWAINIPVKGLMICGYDVCHDPKNKAYSFGALVASYDARATAYYSTVSAHKDGEELSNFIAMGIVKCVMNFAKHTQSIPEKILFYRDGVGDGQISYVYDHELKAMKDQLAPIYAKAEKKLCLRMIVVNKRINTRFFFNGGNPPPGTVVDDVVTLPERSDFYLISQCTNKGTVSPTYYSVLGPDDFNLDSDRTQVLTNRLCHQYYNWGGTVRVPAPCQYAHKLAFLAAQSLQRPPKENLNTLLHFL
ncbi:piwi-like protein Siwi [Atheta coriaria]|uniref:piwi-like protein Siwi n=1 Tax=Dalotia coriaria TaxID=877792 RepID=UPI0031F34AE4